MPGLVPRATPEERLMMVSKQLDAMQQDENINTLACPYCGGMTLRDQPFCCRTFGKALLSLLDARDKVKQIQRMRAN
jgi:hypothetical protein